MLFDRNPYTVRSRVATLGLPQKHPRWNQDDLDYLNENYGLKSAVAIGEHLGRSTNALKIISLRRLGGHNQRANIYTARTVAAVLGVP